MKICRFIYNDEIQYGVYSEDIIFPFTDFENISPPALTNTSTDFLNKSNVTFLPPIQPSKIICVGRNYAAHAAELGNEIPKEPLLFLKAPTSIITNNEEIKIPSQSSQVEYEGELAIVIKRICKNLSQSDNPFDYILGYMCLNDVTARDIQLKDIQFTRAKSFDTFCPIGLFIETELDPSDIRVVTKVNGVIKQDDKTSQMVFSVPTLIKYISQQMTLNMGDIIATGTPAGVSKLKSGDICEVEIEGIGNLINTVKS
jgi:2-keto-4-pentenoate hydratase/2-oxohepta-3-ene-1,7-dioic acid hydratase in catechol pathway